MTASANQTSPPVPGRDASAHARPASVRPPLTLLPALLQLADVYYLLCALPDRLRRARRGGRPRAHRLWFAILLSIVSASACLVFPAPARARTMEVDSLDLTLDYGSRTRGEQFTDTLTFVARDGAVIRAVDVEVTCDCVTAELLAGGRLAFQFDVLDDELDGPTEKLLYVFTDDVTADLLRLALRIDVQPDSSGDRNTTSRSEPSGTGHAPERTVQPLDERRVSSRPLELGFFHSPGCRTCVRIREHTLPELRERWGPSLEIREVSLDTRAGLNRLLAVREHYGLTRRGSSFLIAVGDTALQTTGDLLSRLDAAIERALARGDTTFLAATLPASATGPDRTRSVFRSLSFWTVAGAGLLDGINPCAFATIVFFISLLGYAGSTKRQVLVVGIGFTAAVFTVYLLLGLGAFHALRALAAFEIAARVIWTLTLALLAALVLLSLRDTIQYYRTGQTRDALLQLPRGTKRRIHRVMRKGLKTRNLLLAAIGIGVTVTLFEAACTGQVYLPAIVLMLNDPLLSERAALYLVLYNLLFVAPLIVVFAGAYAGVSSGVFADWQRRHYGATRIALSLLFAALLALMLVQGV